MAFGIGSYIKNTGKKIEKEVKRTDPKYLGVASLFGPTGVLFGKIFERMRDPIRSARRAKKQAETAANQLREDRRQQFEEQQYRQGRQQSLLGAEAARTRRLSMAESVVGEAFGMVGSTPIDGPNTEVNRIPVLDSVDDMGNSIPEVM